MGDPHNPTHTDPHAPDPLDRVLALIVELLASRHDPHQGGNAAAPCARDNESVPAALVDLGLHREETPRLSEPVTKDERDEPLKVDPPIQVHPLVHKVRASS